MMSDEPGAVLTGCTLEAAGSCCIQVQLDLLALKQQQQQQHEQHWATLDQWQMIVSAASMSSASDGM